MLCDENKKMILLIGTVSYTSTSDYNPLKADLHFVFKNLLHYYKFGVWLTYSIKTQDGDHDINKLFGFSF